MSRPERAWPAELAESGEEIIDFVFHEDEGGDRLRFVLTCRDDEASIWAGHVDEPLYLDVTMSGVDAARARQESRFIFDWYMYGEVAVSPPTLRLVKS